MALTAGFMTESTQSLIGLMVVRIGAELELHWEFGADLLELRRQLSRLDSLLLGAESSNNTLLEDWLGKVRMVVYQAEDSLDDYAYQLLKRRLMSNPKRQEHKRPQSWISRMSGMMTMCLSMRNKSNPMVFHFGMVHEVKFLRQSIAVIYADANNLGIKPVDVVAAVSTYSNMAALQEQRLRLRRQLVGYEKLIGRETARASITDLVLCASANDHLLNLVGILGMAGLGKTAICRSIFHGEEVKRSFDEQIWVCVSHDFDIQQLLNDMVEQIDKQASTMSNIHAIIQKLQHKLQNKRYILVLDDVWDTFSTEWESVLSSLQSIGGLEGTMIVVISRSNEVLENLRIPSNNAKIYKLAPFTDNESWSLFGQAVGDGLLDSQKASIGKRMLQRCGGVPSAIMTLGLLLRARNKTQEWVEIEGSDIWNDRDGILPSIKLSFKYLPFVPLKKCFAYSATFREGEVMEKDKLIQLWMAQGYLYPYDKMEDIGDQYLNILLDNSLFQDAKFDDLIGDVKSCKIHDVTHALARSILGQELYTSSSDDDMVNGISNEVRHLSLYSERGLSPELGNNLRTLFVSNFDISRLDFITNIKCLRALSMVNVGIKQLPDSIKGLRLLRYLDISENSIQSLPVGITELFNLQTLRIFDNKDSEESYLPMASNGFSRLVNLRHLCTSRGYHIGIPVGLGTLTCLRTLPSINLLADWGGRLSELGSLTKLKGALTIEGLEKVKLVEAMMVYLWKKENIEQLVLKWSDSYDSRQLQEGDTFKVLGALCPRPNLVTLEISGYLENKLPRWVSMMSGYEGAPLRNLVSLTFSKCSNLLEFPSLNGLVALKKLTINLCISLVTPLDLGSLGSLEEFEMINLSSLRKVCLDDTIHGCMSLRCLRLKGCTEMENLPSVGCLLSLKELEIVGCKKMSCLPNGISKIVQMESLYISDCPNLETSCDPNNEKGWRNISHIPRIKTDWFTTTAPNCTFRSKCLPES